MVLEVVKVERSQKVTRLPLIALRQVDRLMVGTSPMANITTGRMPQLLPR